MMYYIYRDVFPLSSLIDHLLRKGEDMGCFSFLFSFVL